MLRNPIVRFAFAASLAAAAQAQNILNLPFASGTHSWSAPYWTSNVADPTSEAGTVEQLNHVFWLEMHTQQVVLQAGTYVAQAHIQKTTSTSGAYDLAINAESNGAVLSSVTLPVASQTVGSYVWSKEVIFTLRQPTPIDIAVRNTSNVQNKLNYRFDTVRIGVVPRGPVVLHESLDTWNFSNPTFFHRYVSEPTAIYGRVAERDTAFGLTWLDLRKRYSMAAGTHRATVRVRNQNGPGLGADDLFFEALDTQGASLGMVVIPAAAQTAGDWIYAPDLVLTLPAAMDVDFVVYNHQTLTYSFGAQFDSFCLRQVAPVWQPFGTACGGLTLSQASPARIGATTDFQLANVTTAVLGAFTFGYGIQPIALDSYGAVGCKLHVQSFITVFSVFSAANTADFQLSIPNSASFVGVGFDLQGAAFASSAPGNLVTSNGAYFGIGY